VATEVAPGFTLTEQLAPYAWTAHVPGASDMNDIETGQEQLV
jgi:hypothetical protein